jgi:hypothetical protein
MKKEQSVTITPKRRLCIILVAVPLLLCIPLIAMQFCENVNWTLFDFMIAGILLLSAGMILELILRKIKVTKRKIIAIAVLFLVLFLIWAELAVGIFGTPFAGS